MSLETFTLTSSELRICTCVFASWDLHRKRIEKKNDSCVSLVEFWFLRIYVGRLPFGDSSLNIRWHNKLASKSKFFSEFQILQSTICCSASEAMWWASCGFSAVWISVWDSTFPTWLQWIIAKIPNQQFVGYVIRIYIRTLVDDVRVRSFSIAMSLLDCF